MARRDSIADALRAAIDSDPVSAFGGIIGTNREFDPDCAKIVESMFLEVIVAPSFSDDAREVLSKKKNLRLIVARRRLVRRSSRLSQRARAASSRKTAATSQTSSARDAWKVVTKRQPTAEDFDGLEFAWIVCAHVKSNAIVLTNRNRPSASAPAR